MESRKKRGTEEKIPCSFIIIHRFLSPLFPIQTVSYRSHQTCRCGSSTSTQSLGKDRRVHPSSTTPQQLAEPPPFGPPGQSSGKASWLTAEVDTKRELHLQGLSAPNSLSFKKLMKGLVMLKNIICMFLLPVFPD